MKPTIDVVRAIGAEFGRRKLRPLLIAAAGISLALLALGGWLITVNVWWWFLEAVFIAYTLLLIIAAIALRVALRVAEPVQSAKQRQAVRQFADKLDRVAENLQTPQFVIIYRVIRDTVRPGSENFIETVSRDSKSLAPDFMALIKLFSTDRERSRP